MWKRYWLGGLKRILFLEEQSTFRATMGLSLKVNLPLIFEFDLIILEGVNLQAMVFEKAFASYIYHTIEIPKSDLSSEVLVTKVSRQINDYCESKVYLMWCELSAYAFVKKLDFSGITINPETGAIIVILAT